MTDGPIRISEAYFVAAGAAGLSWRLALDETVTEFWNFGCYRSAGRPASLLLAKQRVTRYSSHRLSSAGKEVTNTQTDTHTHTHTHAQTLTIRKTTSRRGRSRATDLTSLVGDCCIFFRAQIIVLILIVMMNRRSRFGSPTTKETRLWEATNNA